ncbi:MAG: chemotaxis protein CheW [Myxococcales bacterium FL481]|nr:MAG: chemotaxis protein CheW [Myxococcales bacterium FL481]
MNPARSQYCTFSVAGDLYGVPVSHVSEVLLGGELTPIPLAPPRVSGLLNLRGEVITAVDLHWLLTGQRGQSGATDEAAHVVVEADGERFALAVDRVHDVIDAKGAQHAPPPGPVRQKFPDIVGELLTCGDTLLTTLRVEALAVTEEIVP